MRFKRFLIGLITICIALLLLFAFWCHPLADDYILSYHFKKSGFWGLQKWIYFNNSGRYTSSLLGALFASKNFLYNYYYVPAIILMVGTWWGIRKLMMNLIRPIHYKSITNTKLISLCTWLFLVILLPEKSTIFYWFSASITYTTGWILFMLYLNCWINLLLEKNGRDARIFDLILIPLLLFLIIGTNELMALFTMSSTIIFFLTRVSHLEKVKK